LGKLAGTLGGDAKLIHKQTNQLVTQFFEAFVLSSAADSEQKVAALAQYLKKYTPPLQPQPQAAAAQADAPEQQQPASASASETTTTIEEPPADTKQ